MCKRLSQDWEKKKCKTIKLKVLLYIIQPKHSPKINPNNVVRDFLLPCKSQDDVVNDNIKTNHLPYHFG